MASPRRAKAKHRPKDRPNARRAPARRPGFRKASPEAAAKSAAAFSAARPAAPPSHIRQRLLEKVATVLDGGDGQRGVAEGGLRLLLELTGARRASVYVQDEQTKRLVCLADSEDGVQQASKDLGRLLARVLQEGVLITSGEILAYPLRCGQRVEGALLVRGVPGTEKHPYSVFDLLNFLSSWLAIGLDRIRLSEKYAQKIHRIRRLEEISEVLNSGLDAQQALRRAIEAAVRLVDAEAGLLLLSDERSQELSCTVTVGDRDDWLEQPALISNQGIAGAVARSGKGLIINEAGHDPRLVMEPGRHPPHGIRTLLAVPVRLRDRTLGVLEAVNKADGRPFSKWDLTEFISLTNQVAIAVENARLFRDDQGKIKRLQKLQEISRVLNSTLNQAEIRKRAIEAATILMDAEAGSLLLLDEAAGELYFDVALGEKGEGVRQIRLKVGQGIAGYVAKTGEPLIINDVQHDPRFSREADRKSGFVTRNMVCVPVKARDKLLGVLQAVNKHGVGLFGEEDLQDFVSLGNQVGIAIENANLYEEINRLFEGFISASVLAIESRDPTTSGHSGRVATLCCGLAEAVDRIDRGPYARVTFDDDQMKELRYAAVLHDFGKVGVREHVLVKADKLFPADLAVLKARFDFIKRTLEVQALRRQVEILMSGDRAAAAALLATVDEELAHRLAETDGLLAFLLACNRPTVLPQGGFERLSEVARLTYESFDGPRPYLTASEVITLSIPKGSLTTEERREIESHVTHTYRFLSTIPWTRSLKNVPMIAYGHHEKLDGSGYPRRVPGDVIPIQTRMMTICDIYDALTASDRPYKAAVPTPKALAILEDEVKHGKVDAGLLEVFVEGKIYHRVRGK